MDQRGTKQIVELEFGSKSKAEGAPILYEGQDTHGFMFSCGVSGGILPGRNVVSAVYRSTPSSLPGQL